MILKDKADFFELLPVVDRLRVPIEKVFQCADVSSGFCRGCGKVSQFNTEPVRSPSDWVNLSEGLVCQCGINGRMRAILRVLDEQMLGRRVGRAVVFERLTPLFEKLRSRFPEIIGSEYLGHDCRAGEVLNRGGVNVRHENMMSQSFSNHSVDLLLHFDVLEHLPDIDAAFSECSRVLTSDGVMIFGCPFYHNLPTSTVRAKLIDGLLHNFMEPVFHGNPVDRGGSLVYSHPSWDIMGSLAQAGFENVQIVLNFDPIEGILSNGCPFPDGHCYPMVFIARR
jgi:SAM-dependent methyltransferase